MYVTLGPPPQNYPLYHTLIHNGTTFDIGATTAAQVIAGVFGDFSEPDVQRVDGTPLRYYGSWATRNVTTESLLRTGDGICDAWGQFFVDILVAQGVPGVSRANLRNPRPRVQREFMLVNNWEFDQNGNLQNGYAITLETWSRTAQGTVIPGPNAAITYTHFNIPVLGDTILRTPALAVSSQPQNGTYAYRWQGNPAVRDVEGIMGQNQSNPASLFNAHILVLINNTWYDPSYGQTYSSLQNFEDNAIAGYVFEKEVPETAFLDAMGRPRDLDGNGSIGRARLFFFRRNAANENDII